MRVNRYIVMALGASFLVGAAVPASFAAPGPRHHEHGGHRAGPGGDRAMMRDVMFVRLLKAADKDKDGKISKEEVTAWQAATFTAIDGNKDETLTPGEIRDYRQARRAEAREARKAERAERRKAAGNEDAAKDMADDTADDAPEAMAKGPEGGPGPREMAEGERGPGRHHGGRHGMGVGPRDMMPGIGLVRMIDTDESGQISKAEASAAADKMFTRMDRNKDGVISIDDLPEQRF
ncbi:calcium-binding protein [Rhizobium sp. SSA_523]|uniref:calcium-binding protein n=1 Tax=Rhizobium sp. SSA_523 TaxID=2952477 RepID=UPI00208FFC83|nr:calcium-binding protein [Rhizobium sp. SSA_523]MCO5732607.1 calcium-binding protein [Rhizobium sp. SSA_523]WKC23758.1 calcium-binding protein [Rhizobium sp. SSA_523]